MIVAHQLASTTDLLTPQAGLLAPAQLMESINFAAWVDRFFPGPAGNRGFPASRFVQTLVLMLHTGAFHLDDVAALREDRALRRVLGLRSLPGASALGKWLRRTGKAAGVRAAVAAVNRLLLGAALHTRTGVTLDIDASEIAAGKAGAQWTYRGNRGYMPMFGHIAETGQALAVDFRAGNVPPAKDNLKFVKRCQKALPRGVQVAALRCDAAGYQRAVIAHCQAQGVGFAIRAKMSPALRETLAGLDSSEWRPMADADGRPTGEQTWRTVWCMDKGGEAFTLVVQRRPKAGQGRLDVDGPDAVEAHEAGGYIHRAIATSFHGWDDARVVHWYNRRGEDSENRIKELKRDLGGDTLPCSDFKANALYLDMAMLAFNLFALMRQLLPEALARLRLPSLRKRLYSLAAKVVRSGRRLRVKLQEGHRRRLAGALALMRLPIPPPIPPPG